MAQQTLDVTIHAPELRFAVMNKTHVTARSLEAGGKLNYEASAHMQASEDPENNYELVRAITSAIGETKVELGEYLNETHTTADNLVSEAVDTYDEFSTTKVYAIGDKVSYNDESWKFKAAHAAGDWSGSDVDKISDIELSFILPSNFNSASSEALGAGIHDFIVGRTIYAWYRQTVPEIAEACRVDAEAMLERVKKALYKRKRPDRPTYA